MLIELNTANIKKRFHLTALRIKIRKILQDFYKFLTSNEVSVSQRVSHTRANAFHIRLTHKTYKRGCLTTFYFLLVELPEVTPWYPWFLANGFFEEPVLIESNNGTQNFNESDL